MLLLSLSYLSRLIYGIRYERNTHKFTHSFAIAIAHSAGKHHTNAAVAQKSLLKHVNTENKPDSINKTFQTVGE